MNEHMSKLIAKLKNIKDFTLDEFDKADVHRIQAMIADGRVVFSRSGPWSGEKYYMWKSNH